MPVKEKGKTLSLAVLDSAMKMATFPKRWLWSLLEGKIAKRGHEPMTVGWAASLLLCWVGASSCHSQDPEAL